MTSVRAMGTRGPGGRLAPMEYELPELGAHDVEIAVSHCGICHSDLSMLDNEWGMTRYPFVPGHEVAGTVAAVGSQVNGLRRGDRVGLGWFSRSCMSCRTCMRGDHNLCATVEQTIVGRHGGFATRVRCSAEWCVPIPEGVDPAKAGPLFCGGITVFNPIVQFGVSPMDRVGVVGMGGVGHLGVQFLRAWGCEVHAFTSSPSKEREALELGAHATINSRNREELARHAGRFDFLLVTANVALDWDLYINLLGPRGRLHVVGAVLEPIPVGAFPLITQQRSVSGSPLGSPATTARMLDFCARHRIEPITEEMPLSKANEALDHLKSGRARYRIVLKNDLA